MKRTLIAVCGVASTMGSGLAYVQPGGVTPPHAQVESGRPSLRSIEVPVEAYEEVLLASDAEAESPSAWESMLRWAGAGLLAGLVASTVASPANAFSEPRTGTGQVLGAFNPKDMTYRGNPAEILSKASVKNWAHLELCKNNKKYNKRYKDLKFKLEKRRDKYPKNSRAYKVDDEVVKNEAVTFQSYGDRYCSKDDGLPRVIATGENVRGGIFIPFCLFIYTTGWIGWAGREYLLRTKSVIKEVFIDVPILLSCMTAGFAWPVKAWQDFTNGRFVAPDNQLNTDVFYKIW